MDIDDPRPIIEAKPFANEDANLINCFGMEGFWSEIERERSTACGRGRSSTRWDPRRIFKVKGKGGRRLTMFTCTKHKFPTKKQGRGLFVSESEGVGSRNPPRRRPAPTISPLNLFPPCCVHAPAHGLLEKRWPFAAATDRRWWSAWQVVVRQVGLISSRAGRCRATLQKILPWACKSRESGRDLYRLG